MHLINLSNSRGGGGNCSCLGTFPGPVPEGTGESADPDWPLQCQGADRGVGPAGGFRPTWISLKVSYRMVCQDGWLCCPG